MNGNTLICDIDRLPLRYSATSGDSTMSTSTGAMRFNMNPPRRQH